MPYRKSVFRSDYELRVRDLLRECKKASHLDKGFDALRDMVFQCAIFQTSAAIETYLRLVIEGWAQALKMQKKGQHLPEPARGFLAARRFQKHFERFALTNDEAALIVAIPKEHQAWPILNPEPALPAFFDGKLLYAESAYPSFKNLKRVLNRIGIKNPEAALSATLRRDVETLIEGFQSVRTALAHASPPAVTLDDIKGLLSDMTALVAAVDRILYRHVAAHGGATCWT
jgi:hypothetical protein